jgi:hypothetical protein
MARLNKLHPRITDERHVAAAKALYNEEGILEVDRGALVSHIEEGAYYGAFLFPAQPTENRQLLPADSECLTNRSTAPVQTELRFTENPSTSDTQLEGRCGRERTRFGYAASEATRIGDHCAQSAAD